MNMATNVFLCFARLVVERDHGHRAQSIRGTKLAGHSICRTISVSTN